MAEQVITSVEQNQVTQAYVQYLAEKQLISPIFYQKLQHLKTYLESRQKVVSIKVSLVFHLEVRVRFM